MEAKSGISVQGVQSIHMTKKYALGGQMNAEEARMNRNLLKEIAEKRRMATVSNASPV
jgi:hypothetical protein